MKLGLSAYHRGYRPYSEDGGRHSVSGVGLDHLRVWHATR